MTSSGPPDASKQDGEMQEVAFTEGIHASENASQLLGLGQKKAQVEYLGFLTWKEELRGKLGKCYARLHRYLKS